MLALAVSVLLMPSLASAHAVIEKMTPAVGERMAKGPDRIELVFNEAIESKVGSLKVLDKRSKAVGSAEPVTSEDGRTLSLALPALEEGVYTVSYNVISADGHPVTGSYVFIVGDPPEAVDASNFNLHTQLGHEGHVMSTQLGGRDFILYAMRIAYYAALMLAAGLLLWSAIARKENQSLGRVRRKWELPVARTLLVVVLLFVFIQATEMMKGYPASEYAKLFGQTSVGRGWLLLIVLAAALFPVLKLGSAARAVWAVLILGVESWSGHAVVYSPKFVTVLLDFVHLAGAALWSGGLVLLLALWKFDRKEAGRFAEQFSQMALLSIAVMTVSGVAMTLFFLPSLDYLLYTPWGKMLIAKTALVVLVLIVGALLRFRVRKGQLPPLALLRVDLGLMALIIAIVGIFTYITPLPANEPILYHKMGEKQHLTLRISPNKPGADNTFILRVWLPQNVGPAKSVRMRMISLDRPDLGAIEVPLKPFVDEETSEFTGFIGDSLKAEGPFLPFAGKWQAEMRFITQNDDEIVERYEFRNY
ncbi:copper resistance CopC/CopD family protein [Paenibacillus aurantiacus]|uniref:Copper resistance CopC/CopD family protein n=1 Tax=Paenibacillus aurantiacus TaxID=1936118 RepID=A0ABV5L0H8_9BACL